MATTDEEGVLWIPSPFYSDRGVVPRWLIIHGTAGGTTAEAIASWFQNPNAQVSAHYVVGRDGTVIQCVREGDAAWANGPISGPSGVGGDGIHHDTWWDNAPLWGGVPNPNPVTISIEHVKPSSDNSDVLTEPQRASSFALIKHICQRNGIPMRKADASGGITGHFSIDPVNRSRCPGSYPWDALWTYLKGGTMGVPNGWHDDGKTLTAPNGVYVTDGFRQWVLAHSWDAGNLPLMNASALTPVEQGNPSLGSGTVQPFRLCVLAWTQAKGVYVMWVGQEYVALHQVLHKALTDLNASQAQVKALQAQLLAAQNSGPLATELVNRLNQIHTLSDTTGDFVK
jgi:N-acetyl-anhydromuramyl-L-alanine amidase AmpD